MVLLMAVGVGIAAAAICVLRCCCRGASAAAAPPAEPAARRRRPKPNAADVELGRLPTSPSHSHARRERREQKARLVGATEGAHVEL